MGTNIVVSSLDPNDNIVEICVFVQNTTEFNCPNAIEVVVDSESCECDCTCYTIIGDIKAVIKAVTTVINEVFIEIIE